WPGVVRVSTRFVLRFVAISVVSFTVLGCASSPDGDVSNRDVPGVVESLPAVTVEDAVELQLGAGGSRTETLKHVSRTVSKSYERGRLRDQQENSVEFETQSDIHPRSDGVVEQSVRTLEKKGNIDLRLLAFPEPGETLDLRLTKDGRVLRAGRYSKESVFFVPPISLPSEPVRVGDTWVLVAEWTGFEENTPFQLEMVSVLKGFVACGQDQCADVELSGEVKLPFEIRQLVGFDSEWRGRLLFSRQSGSLVWSRLDSVETMRAEGVFRRVHSCLESVLVAPEASRASSIAGPTCEGGRMPAAFRE
ncbi:MAG: hypothetical protein NDI61_10215, partial [Bdellovibrionaceae bacterium]|nr:hypothetical protein [Pseudobdellovibrionaceae bacterium]